MNKAQFISAPQMVSDMESYAISLVEEINEGREYALDVFIAAKRWQKTIEILLSNIEEQVLMEAERNGKHFEYKGVEMNIRELGSRWNFENCNDPFYNRILLEKKDILEKEKERSVFLKGIKSKTVIVDDETGEVCQIVPPTKSSKTGVVAMFK